MAFKKINKLKKRTSFLKELRGKRASEAKKSETKMFLKRGIFLVRPLKNKG